MAVSPIELPPRVVEALRETRNGRQVLADMMPGSEKQGILNTVKKWGKRALIVGGILALGSHTGLFRNLAQHMPRVGGALDAAGNFAIDAGRVGGQWISSIARRGWDLLGQGWEGLRGSLGPAPAPEMQPAP